MFNLFLQQSLPVTMSVISTPITELFGIKHPILLAGASTDSHDGMNLTARAPCRDERRSGSGACRCCYQRRWSWCDWGCWLHAQNFAAAGRPGRSSRCANGGLTLVIQISALKKDLKDPNAPFGVDLLIPQVGGSARKTNVRHLFRLQPSPL